MHQSYAVIVKRNISTKPKFTAVLDRKDPTIETWAEIYDEATKAYYPVFETHFRLERIYHDQALMYIT